MDSNGRVKYRGRWFTIDKPTTSTRATKKKNGFGGKIGMPEIDSLWRSQLSAQLQQNRA